MFQLAHGRYAPNSNARFGLQLAKLEDAPALPSLKLIRLGTSGGIISAGLVGIGGVGTTEQKKQEMD